MEESDYKKYVNTCTFQPFLISSAPSSVRSVVRKGSKENTKLLSLEESSRTPYVSGEVMPKTKNNRSGPGTEAMRDHKKHHIHDAHLVRNNGSGNVHVASSRGNNSGLKQCSVNTTYRGNTRSSHLVAAEFVNKQPVKKVAPVPPKRRSVSTNAMQRQNAIIRGGGTSASASTDGNNSRPSSASRTRSASTSTNPNHGTLGNANSTMSPFLRKQAQNNRDSASSVISVGSTSTYRSNNSNSTAMGNSKGDSDMPYSPYNSYAYAFQKKTQRGVL